MMCMGVVLYIDDDNIDDNSDSGNNVNDNDDL
jgi:hypothetical protein